MLSGIVEVLGNGRLFLTIAGTLLLVVLGGGTRALSWGTVGLWTLIWIGANVLYDVLLRARRAAGGRWLTSPMRFGNWRFGLYLVLLSGFWIILNQIFMTLPEYLRDFADTTPILRWMESAFAFLGLEGAAAWAGELVASGYQINPEYIVNIDAFAIVLFQVFVSWSVARFRAFTTMIGGLVIVAAGMAITALGAASAALAAWLAVLGILVFSFGEMATSPKSQEYVGRIAPPDKVAMYMGYYFVSIALGQLFGGILSGALYGWLARDLRRPDLMWLSFAVLALLTTAALFAYDRWVLPRPGAQSSREAVQSSA